MKILIFGGKSIQKKRLTSKNSELVNFFKKTERLLYFFQVLIKCKCVKPKNNIHLFADFQGPSKAPVFMKVKR